MERIEAVKEVFENGKWRDCKDKEDWYNHSPRDRRSRILED